MPTNIGHGQQVWVGDFMPAVVERIVGQCPPLDKSRVFRSLYPPEDHLAFPVADRFVTLFNGSYPVDEKNVLGGGTHNTAFDHRMTMTAFVRLEADPEHHSTQQLADEASGVDAFVKQLITSLHTWDGPEITDPDDPTISRYAFRRPVLNVKPGFEIRTKTGPDGRRWAVVSVAWQLSFVADLGNPYPTNGA